MIDKNIRIDNIFKKKYEAQITFVNSIKNANKEQLQYVAEALLLCFSTLSLRGNHLNSIEGARGLSFVRELCDELMKGDSMISPYRDTIGDTFKRWQEEAQ